MVKMVMGELVPCVSNFAYPDLTTYKCGENDGERRKSRHTTFYDGLGPHLAPENHPECTLLSFMIMQTRMRNETHHIRSFDNPSKSCGNSRGLSVNKISLEKYNMNRACIGQDLISTLKERTT